MPPMPCSLFLLLLLQLQQPSLVTIGSLPQVAYYWSAVLVAAPVAAAAASVSVSVPQVAAPLAAAASASAATSAHGMGHAFTIKFVLLCSRVPLVATMDRCAMECRSHLLPAAPAPGSPAPQHHLQGTGACSCCVKG
jgi:hypothetical protein